ncbi:hypothetical protein [Kitasatospora kifunensis]|uniref:Uncharacterized protein n=1 Tax=Kitasatospora kifunensis TaxID=58351 RepID=A0A7W7QZ59_KITKI|nr:hypothetical protein [Kitasatospora kifunensis]MBB4922208.1 hypothetical protein [Kitasatospora kifunensis]
MAIKLAYPRRAYEPNGTIHAARINYGTYNLACSPDEQPDIDSIRAVVNTPTCPACATVTVLCSCGHEEAEHDARNQYCLKCERTGREDICRNYWATPVDTTPTPAVGV